MPLKKSSNPKDISRNISEMVHAGHPQKVAVAAAMSKAREAKDAQKNHARSSKKAGKGR